MILSLILWIGFAPLYRRFASIPEAELRRALPHFFLIFPAMAAFVVFKQPIRLLLPRAAGGIAPRFVPDWPIFTLSPMLAFDLWTPGGATLVAGLRVL